MAAPDQRREKPTNEIPRPILARLESPPASGSAASAPLPSCGEVMEQIGNYAAACCTKSPDFIIASCLTRSRAKRSAHQKS